MPDAVTPSLDPDVARWLERAEALASQEIWLSGASVPGDETKPVTEVIAGGVAFALTGLDVGFFNRAIGLGTEEPVSEAGIRAVSQFFQRHGRAQSVIQIAPASITPAVEGWLAAEGYAPGKYAWVKLWHDLQAIPEPPTSLRVGKIGPEHATVWAEIFAEAMEFPPITLPLMIGPIGRPGWTHFAAFDGDTPVATGAMFVTDGVAWLGYGGTREAFRGRGAQSAIFAARLARARELGCRMAITETGEETEDEPVNHSYRNMRRMGFELAYARRNWRRIPEEPSA